MGMADVEKVKQGLKAHTDECAWVCNENCPYYEPSEYGCCDKLTADALSVIESLQSENKILTENNIGIDEQRGEIAVRLESLRLENERLKAERRWIPVSERLPETWKAVLVCCDGKFHDAMVVAYIDALGLWHPISGDNIAYWMPLPEPPKDGDGE